MNFCRELRPWYELSQNAVSGLGRVLRYCQLWLYSGMTHFELLFLTQSVSYWWWHSLRHCNSCLPENATVWMIWIVFFSISKCVIFNLSIANLLDSRQVATPVVFFQYHVDPLWNMPSNPPTPPHTHTLVDVIQSFFMELGLFPEDYSCGCNSVIPTPNLSLLVNHL